MAGSSPSGLPHAEAVDLAGFVGYEAGSIVSRTLAKSGGGTVTLFSFDAGQELSEHTAPFDAFVLVLDGRAEVTVGGKKVLPEAGQIVLMPAHVPHAVRALERFKMLLILVRNTIPMLG